MANFTEYGPYCRGGPGRLRNGPMARLLKQSAPLGRSPASGLEFCRRRRQTHSLRQSAASFTTDMQASMTIPPVYTTALFSPSGGHGSAFLHRKDTRRDASPCHYPKFHEGGARSRKRTTKSNAPKIKRCVQIYPIDLSERRAQGILPAHRLDARWACVLSLPRARQQRGLKHEATRHCAREFGGENTRIPPGLKARGAKRLTPLKRVSKRSGRQSPNP